MIARPARAALAEPAALSAAAALALTWALALTSGALLPTAGWAAGLTPQTPRATQPLPGRLHVPSPDWRDQVIYFVVTDRFADGDPSNNDLGQGEYRPSSKDHHNGGDLRGLKDRLAYIQGLGASAVWITPPVANQWMEPQGQSTGYHGYWAQHLGRMDAHVGTLADYQALSRALHGRQMYLVQDIVLNHMGNYFAVDGSSASTMGWRSTQPAAPTQWPFSRNDPRRSEDRRLGAYHWTPDISDYGDPFQTFNFQMAGLDDLNTESPLVRRTLRASYAHWLRQAGVDAFRVDTAFYVPPELFTDFLHSRDPQAPGLLHVARSLGRTQFHVFGEGFAIDRPFETTQAERIESYMHGPGGKPLLPGMINFPLYGSLGDVFGRGQATAQLAHRIQSAQTLHPRTHWMPSFLDNHDVDRFLAGASVPALEQALLALFTLPGIPTIYYGTEQGYTEPRAALFAAGWGSGGRDRFDTQAPLYQRIKQLAQLRRELRLFSRGQPRILQSNEAAPGVLAYRVDWLRPVGAAKAQKRRLGGGAGSAKVLESALVVFNTAEHTSLLHTKGLGLVPGSALPGLLNLQGAPQALGVDAQGEVSLALAPRAGAVWKLPIHTHASASASASAFASAAQVANPAMTADLTVDPPGAPAANGELRVSGRATPGLPLQLVVDGNLEEALNLVPDAQGRWQAMVDTNAWADAHTAHSLVAWRPAVNAGSDGNKAGLPSADPKAMLNKSPRMRGASIWDALQGANHSHSPAMARICNAAERPKRGAARREGLFQHCPNPPTALSSGQTSNAQTLRVQRAWVLAAEQADPAGDDHGPSGSYVYPLDASYQGQRSMDLRHVQAWVAGGALRVSVQMAGLTKGWNPANGFDHLALTLFIQLPGQPEGSGASVMPLQMAELPDTLRWHRRLRVHGWSNALFSAEGATAQVEGKALTPGAALQVDAASKTLHITLPAAALGKLPSLSGLKLYVTTWDYDGGYRALDLQPQAYSMGGGRADAPRIMDNSAVLTLP